MEKPKVAINPEQAPKPPTPQNVDATKIQISSFTSIADRSPVAIPLSTFAVHVASDTYAQIVGAIRAEKDKKRRSELKKRLPAVTLSGVFEGGHKAEQLKQPSQLMQIDFDNVDVEAVKMQLVKDPYTLMAFVSPSGTGIKGVVRYEGEHLAAFHALTEYYRQTYSLEMDKSCKDISRLCFFSHDTTPYFNPNAEIYEPPKVEQPAPPARETPKPKSAPRPAPAAAPVAPTSLDEHEKVQSVIAEIAAKQIDITSPYDEWLKCALALSSEFGEAGRSYFHGVSRFHSGYNRKDCDRKFDDALKSKAKTVSIAYFYARAKAFGVDISACYREKLTGSREPKRTANPAANPPVQRPVATTPVSPPAPPTSGEKQYTQEELAELHSFYYIKKNKHGGFKEIDFEEADFLEFMRKMGLSIYSVDNLAYKFVIVKDNILEEILPDFISPYIGEKILELPPIEVDNVEYDRDTQQYLQIKIQVTAQMIYNAFLKHSKTFCAPTFLMNLLPKQRYRMIEDKQNIKYFFYKNGIITVTGDGVYFSKYENLGGCVWRDQILDRNWEPCEGETGVFEQFAQRLAYAYKPDTNREIDETASQKRIESLCSIIGYNMHFFFDTRRFAVNFTDSRMSEDGEANGRSGKTLLVKAISAMLTSRQNSSVYVELGGKNFDVKDKHKYARCSIDTKLIHLNDLSSRFKIEPFFNDITEGVEIRQLFKGSFVINAKMIFSSNKTLWLNGDSEKDRILIFEVSEHYGTTYRPKDEFGQWFFTDWDTAEWARFDDFMIRCASFYLKNGIVEAPSINLKARAFREHTHPVFDDWMKEQFKEYDDDGNIKSNLPIRVYEGEGDPKSFRIDKKELYERFIGENSDFGIGKNRLTLYKFTLWLKKYASHRLETVYEPQRSNGNEYFTFVKKPAE